MRSGRILDDLAFPTKIRVALFPWVVLSYGLKSLYTATFDVAFIVVEPAMDGSRR